MNIFEKTLYGVDRFQRKHKLPAYAVAVVKKYTDDQAGYQAALITYYGFLSLFPILLIVTTIAGAIGRSDPELGQKIVDSVSSYFPVIGLSLAASIKGFTQTGMALVIGILFAIYGTRGIADAFRNAVNHVWHIPTAKRSGFPRSLIRSGALIVLGGIGFMLASIIAGWTAAAGSNTDFHWWYRVLSVVINVGVLYLVFLLLLRLSLPLNIPYRRFRLAAIISAIGLTVLQLAAGFILAHESRTLSTTYSAVFAPTLGLLAWIYLQAQVVMYAVVTNTVRDKKLWPRGLTNNNPTKADKRAEQRRSLV